MIPTSAATAAPSSTPASPGAGTAAPAVPTRPDVRRVTLFMAIATAITTALSLPFALGALPAATVGVVIPLAQLSPLLAGLLVRERGVTWWRSLGLSVPSWRRLALASFIALMVMVLVPLVRVVVGAAAGAPLTEGAPLLGLLTVIPLVFVMQSLFSIGEEAGWRGWLHRELAPLGFWTMSAVIGVMWALWHLPIVLALGLQGREAVAYLVTIVVVAPLLASLREVSGTVWAAVIGHGLLNSVRVAMDQNVLGPLDPGAAWALDIVSWISWIAAAWMVMRLVGPLAVSRRSA